MSVRIIIELAVDDELGDRNDPTGLTEEAHMELSVKLAEYGDIVDIRRAPGGV